MKGVVSKGSDLTFYLLYRENVRVFCIQDIEVVGSDTLLWDNLF